MKQEAISIKELVQLFANEQIKLIKKLHKEHAGKVVLCGNRDRAEREISNIEAQLSVWNTILSQFSKLFVDCTANSKVFNEIKLLAMNIDHAESQLKLRYIHHNKITKAYPGINPGKLAEIFDFTEEQRQLIEGIMSNIHQISLKTTNDLDYETYSEYISSNNGTAILSDIHRQEIMRKHITMASDDKIGEVLSLSMLCSSLESLRVKDNRYSFNELPEIDHYIVGLLTWDRRDGNNLGINMDAIGAKKEAPIIRTNRR